MIPGNEVRRDIEGCEILHPAFVKLQQYLVDAIEDTLSAHEPRLEWLIGPSRIGKSKLIATLQRAYPPKIVEGVKHVPVLTVVVPPFVSPKMLPSIVLNHLGVPLPPRGITTGLMFKRMKDQLTLAQTKVLIVEEASMLVDVGARVPPRAAGDWIKAVMDEVGITFLLFGVPRLEKLFSSNEQLEGRSSAGCELHPYDFKNHDEMMAFAACVKTYAGIFHEHGYPMDISLESLVKNCYLLGGGSLGMVSRFMRELAKGVNCDSPRPLDLDDLNRAARVVANTAHPDIKPFSSVDVSPLDMGLAYRHVYEKNAMPWRRKSVPLASI